MPVGRITASLLVQPSTLAAPPSSDASAQPPRAYPRVVSDRAVPDRVPPDRVHKERWDPMFGEHPLRGTLATAHGTVSFPFQGYRTDGLALIGLADLDVLEEVMRGSGYSPIVTDGGKGIVTLWLMDNVETNLGPYQELVVTIAASPTPRHVSYENAYSLLAPIADERMHSFAYRLVMPNPVAIDVGRRGMGLDKREGDVAITHHETHKSYTVRDAQGRVVLQGRTAIDKGLGAKLDAFTGLVSGLGLGKTLKTLTRGTYENNLITFDVNASGPRRPVIVNRSFSKATPSIHEVHASDRLCFGADSEAGRALARLNFVPRLAYAAPDVRTAYDMPSAPPRAMPFRAAKP